MKSGNIRLGRLNVMNVTVVTVIWSRTLLLVKNKILINVNFKNKLYFVYLLLY